MEFYQFLAKTYFLVLEFDYNIANLVNQASKDYKQDCLLILHNVTHLVRFPNSFSSVRKRWQTAEVNLSNSKWLHPPSDGKGDINIIPYNLYSTFQVVFSRTFSLPPIVFTSLGVIHIHSCGVSRTSHLVPLANSLNS